VLKADARMDELVDMAVGVLGDSIDHEGGGWQGEPWLMLVVPNGDGEVLPVTCGLYGAAPAERLAELVEAFRELLPVACALVIPVELAFGGATVTEGKWAALITLDGEGDERAITCEVNLAQSGREALWPAKDVPTELWHGVVDTLMRDALAASCAVRAHETPSDTGRWDELLAVARSALAR
jgi:hypothetical protein